MLVCKLKFSNGSNAHIAQWALPILCVQALQHRTDGKLYRIQTPQTPIARTQRYSTYKMDEFPSGMNMMVAVLAYTGATQPFAAQQLAAVIAESHSRACATPTVLTDSNKVSRYVSATTAYSHTVTMTALRCTTSQGRSLANNCLLLCTI